MDLGLATIETISFLSTVFAAVNLVLEEMESRTLYLILTRPVARAIFITGPVRGPHRHHDLRISFHDRRPCGAAVRHPCAARPPLCAQPLFLLGKDRGHHRRRPRLFPLFHLDRFRPHVHVFLLDHGTLQHGNPVPCPEGLPAGPDLFLQSVLLPLPELPDDEHPGHSAGDL